LHLCFCNPSSFAVCLCLCRTRQRSSAHADQSYEGHLLLTNSHLYILLSRGIVCVHVDARQQGGSMGELWFMRWPDIALLEIRTELVPARSDPSGTLAHAHGGSGSGSSAAATESVSQMILLHSRTHPERGRILRFGADATAAAALEAGFATLSQAHAMFATVDEDAANGGLLYAASGDGSRVGASGMPSRSSGAGRVAARGTLWQEIPDVQLPV
jgi:hypothetical protein